MPAGSNKLALKFVKTLCSGRSGCQGGDGHSLFISLLVVVVVAVASKVVAVASNRADAL